MIYFTDICLFASFIHFHFKSYCVYLAAAGPLMHRVQHSALMLMYANEILLTSAQAEHRALPLLIPAAYKDRCVSIVFSSLAIWQLLLWPLADFLWRYLQTAALSPSDTYYGGEITAGRTLM